jgi:hypothetical protein
MTTTNKFKREKYETEMEELVDKFDDLFNEKVIDDFISLFSYEGFDPLYTYAILKEKSAKLKSDFAGDMSTFIAFVVLKGTTIRKMKISSEGAEKIKALISRYGVKTKDGPKTKSDLTLGRIASCFPILISKFIDSLADYEPTGGVVAGLPLRYHFPGAPAIIPKDEERAYNLWQVYARNFAQVIGSGDSGADYGKIIWDSSLVSDEKRKEDFDLKEWEF